jgi:hypothetical protein
MALTAGHRREQGMVRDADNYRVLKIAGGGPGLDAGDRIDTGSVKDVDGYEKVRLSGAGASGLPATSTGATAATDQINLKVTGDTNDRFVLNTDGSMEFGPGNAVADVVLQRDADVGIAKSGLELVNKPLRVGAAVIDGKAGGGNELYIDNAAVGSSLIRLVANNQVEVTGHLFVNTVGKGIGIKEGSNAKMGSATLVAGTVTVNTSAVFTNSRIFLDIQTPGGTPGFLRVSARSSGTSFTILSSSGTDTSVVAWLIIEPL